MSLYVKTTEGIVYKDCHIHGRWYACSYSTGSIADAAVPTVDLVRLCARHHCLCVAVNASSSSFPSSEVVPASLFCYLISFWKTSRKHLYYIGLYGFFQWLFCICFFHAIGRWLSRPCLHFGLPRWLDCIAYSPLSSVFSLRGDGEELSVFITPFGFGIGSNLTSATSTSTSAADERMNMLRWQYPPCQQTCSRVMALAPDLLPQIAPSYRLCLGGQRA